MGVVKRHDEQTLRVTDDLGHDLPATTAWLRQQMIEWLGLEGAAGELSDGLRLMRDLLIADEAADQ